MRILHLNTQRKWRGGENQLFLLAKAQLERGHDVAVACPLGSRLSEEVSDVGIEHLIWRAKGEWDFPAGYAVARFIQGWKPDVLHAHDSRSVSFLGKKRDELRIAHRRVDFNIKSSDKYIRKADCVISISEAIQEIMVECNIPADMIRLVHSGIDPQRFANRPERDAAREMLGVPADKKLIVTVGALVDHKAHDIGLTAIRHLLQGRDDAMWWIAGTGKLLDKLITQASILGFTDDGPVSFLGNRNDIDVLLAAADLYYHPSRLEGLGTAILDAMCCSLPVVATDVGGIPEVVADSITGRLVMVDDPEDHAEKLAMILGNPEMAARMAQQGQEKFESEFTSDRMADEILEVYRELLAKRTSVTAE